MFHMLLAEWCNTEKEQINVNFQVGQEAFNKLGVYNMKNVL